MGDLRSTQQVVEAVYAADPDLRSTQQVIEVIYTISTGEVKQLTANISATANATAALRQKKFLTADVFSSANVIANFPGTKQLDVEIAGTAIVSANLTIPKLTAGISASTIVTANLTGIRQFVADFNVSAKVTADLSVKVLLTADINCSGVVDADIRENIQYLTADIVNTGNVASVINVPFHPGNSLVFLTHEVAVTLVLARDVESVLELTHQVDLVFGQRSLDTQNTILFTHSVDVDRVLPVKVASSTLSLTHSAIAARATTSFLVLNQMATGVISFLEGIATSELTLSQSVNTAGSVIGNTVESVLALTQSAVNDSVILSTVTNTLDLTQNAFGIVLASKTFVILQAPFDLIQTSIVLPNPLLDDNESLVSNLTLRRSMGNTIRTYVKTSNSRRVRYTFTLDRLKSLELEAFFDAYNGTEMRMINWKGQIWRVKLITNPLDFVQTRSYNPNGDRTDVNLEFEGVLLNG